MTAGWSDRAASDGCNYPVTIGVDLEQADTTTMAFSCRGIGQVFLAADTLIESISIWRGPWPPHLDAAPRRLFITETFSYNGQIIPDANRLLLDEVLNTRTEGDGIHPVEYRWVFDPPFALPHRGHFYFDVLATYYSGWLVPAATTNPYPDGQAWGTGPLLDCLTPGEADDYRSPPHVDLIFAVRFCSTGATAARPKSWGRTRLIYR